MDKEDLAVGEHWERAIPRAIRDSDFFLACVSHQFNERGFLQREIKVALDVLKEIPSGQVFVLPIVLEPSCRVPEELQHAQWDEYFRPGGIGRLLTAISQHSGCELRIPPPYATWPQTPVDIDEFSPKLVSEIDRVAGDFSSSLLRRLHEAEAEEAIPGRKALEALARGVKPSQELDIEISCIDDQGVFRVHPWRGVVGSDVEAEWTEAKGSAFVDWLRNRLRSEWSGHLTWTDTLASDPRLEGQVQAESLDYERRTVVSFSNVPVVGDRAWTVCIEGHEVVRLRRGDRPKA